MNTDKFLTKGILSLATAAIMMAGCSDDKIILGDESGRPVAFRLQGNLPASRATGTTVYNVNAFVVNGQVYDNDDKPLPDPLFDAQTVARVEGEANSFDYYPKRYYPDAAAHACFPAYSPVTPNVSSGFKGSTANMITYTVLPPDSVSGNTRQEDLLVAYTKVDGAVQPADKAPVSRAGFDQAVSLTFKHALSRVFVKASNSNVEPVVIKRLSLNNLYDKGVLDIDGTGWTGSGVYTPAGSEVDINEGYIDAPGTSPNDYKVLWSPISPQTSSYRYVLPPSGVSVAARTDVKTPIYVVSKEQGMLVMPQTTRNSNYDAEVDLDANLHGDFYVEVTYDLSNIKNKTVRAAFKDINKLDAGLTFEFGKQYALEIAFSGTAITFAINVEDWNVEDKPAVAASTVVFNANKPEGVAADVAGIHDPNSNFIYGEALPTLTGSAPTLADYLFQGYYDAPAGGKKYYNSNLTAATTTWDKAGPAQMLYAQWRNDYIELEALPGVKWALGNVDIPGAVVKNQYEYGLLYEYSLEVGWSNTDPLTGFNSSGSDVGASQWGSVSSSWPEWPTNKTQGPCPTGWRVPDGKELKALNAISCVDGKYAASGDGAVTGRWFGTIDLTTAQASPFDYLFFPAAGERDNNGILKSPGTSGAYWSTESYGPSAYWPLKWGDSGISQTDHGDDDTQYKYAISIRCVKK